MTKTSKIRKGFTFFEKISNFFADELKTKKLRIFKIVYGKLTSRKLLFSVEKRIFFDIIICIFYQERNGNRMKESVAAELASKAIQGDMKAYEQIYTEFSPLIYSILLEITHDAYEAEDLTQDCFVSALKNIHTLKDPSKIKKWLTAIAANHGKDYLKKKKPALLSEEHDYIFDIQKEENESVLPEESAVLDERSEEIREIVNSVSEDKRLCLVLFYQHEMSITEISEELGISESAVKSRLFRAREDIKEEVEKRSKRGMPLFGVAPLPLILFALQKSSQAASVSFAGSAAQTAVFTGVTAASQAGIAVASTAATATTASAAGTTATAATGIGAKVAAMSVAQKVIAGVAAATIATGSATVTTVVVKNKIEAKEETTTAYTEEYTTAPVYGFESATVFMPAVAETESSTAEFSTSNKSTSTVKQSTTATHTKETEKSTVANKTTTKSTTKAGTTTQKQTTTTTKPQTTTTTKTATTRKETTTEEVTTKPTTTKAVTTTTTTKATTTTESASPATVTVTVWGESSSTTKTLYFEAGEKITATEIENRLSDEYGIEAIADDINITAEAGGNYTATAYE